MSWAAVLGLSLGAYAFKLAGVVAGDRFAARLAPVTVLLPAALFSALVVVMAMADGRSLVVDGRMVGVAFGALAVARRAPFIVVVLVAMASTAGVRLLT